MYHRGQTDPPQISRTALPQQRRPVTLRARCEAFCECAFNREIIKIILFTPEIQLIPINQLNLGFRGLIFYHVVQ